MRSEVDELLSRFDSRRTPPRRSVAWPTARWRSSATWRTTMRTMPAATDATRPSRCWTPREFASPALTRSRRPSHFRRATQSACWASTRTVSTPDARDLRAVRRHVARAVAAVTVVIVTMHLGAEGPSAQRTKNATERFLQAQSRQSSRLRRRRVRRWSDARHRPRSARAARRRMARRHGSRCTRSATLLTYGPFKLREPTNRGAVACATIDSAGSVSHAELRPTMQLWPGVLQPDSTRPRVDADRFVERAGFSEKRRDRRHYGRIGKKKATLRSLIPAVSAPAPRLASRAAAVSLGDSTRRAPRQILISGENGRSSGALDHLSGHAAGVHVPAVADVDADVAHAALLSLSERQQSPGRRTAGVATHGEALLRLLLSGARDVQVERGHDVLDESAAIEASFRRHAAGPVPLADLRARHLNDRIAHRHAPSCCMPRTAWSTEPRR